MVLENLGISLHQLVTGVSGILMVAQVVFYIGTGVIVLLTYLNAKRGLFSPVHTEYMKHVIDRLKELAQELDTEFDPESPNYWAADETTLLDQDLKEQVDQINDDFAQRKEELRARGEWEPWTHGHSRRHYEIKRLVRSIRSDPFLPPTIRDKIVAMLDGRSKALFDAEEKASNSYRRALVTEGPLHPPERHYNAVNNTIVRILHDEGFNIDQVEEKVVKIRLAIQDYLSSFAPYR